MFGRVDWLQASSTVNEFDDVLTNLIDCLDDLEETADADDLLLRYEQIIPAKTARYINYCDAKCHSFWTRGEYVQAVEWGTRGDDLKRRSNVDTKYDCANNLALAKRDSGHAAEALPIFLKSYELSDLLDPDFTSALDDGPLYGNVGRCLHLMQRFDDALFCYKISARALEKDESTNRISNQAFARQWIAETFSALAKKDLAWMFFMDAEHLTKKIAPARARGVRASMNALYPDFAFPVFALGDARRQVELWIRGND